MVARVSSRNSAYEIWRWEGDADSAHPDPAVARILSLLDPVRSQHCVLCGAVKAQRDAGRVSCADCARRCPDPDCKGTPRRVKEPQAEMCGHCAAFVRRLDAPCHGRPRNCDIDECKTDRIASGNADSVECFGPGLERNGYFVYQLETGYIGMTYNPERRQFEHDRSAEVRRYIDTRPDIDYPEAYFRAAYSDIDERWEAHFNNHWDRVRSSDRDAPGARRIKWLSPKLDTRAESYRCEWALKQYRREASGLFPGFYDEAIGVSAFPVIKFQSAGLDYDVTTGRVSFDLSWDTVEGLGPSQVIPVSGYELQRQATVAGNWIDVASGSQADFSGQLGPDLIGDWRVRAVNFDNIPGPWAEFPVSLRDIAMSVQKLVAVADVRAELDYHDGSMLVRWSVGNPVPGIRYQVERSGNDGSCVVIEAGNATQLRDPVAPTEVTAFQYRVRAVLDGVGGNWQSGDARSRCIVGGAVPGSVVKPTASCLTDGSISLKWQAPEWPGREPLQGYQVEIVRDGCAPDYIGIPDTVSWHDDDSCVGNLAVVTYRVCPWNVAGNGPWSESVSVNSDARRDAIRSGLSSASLLYPATVDGQSLHWQWDVAGNGSWSYEWEIDQDNEVALLASDKAQVAMPVDWSSVSLITIRSRAVYHGITGSWSVPVAVRPINDCENAMGLEWPRDSSVGFVVVGWDSGFPAVFAVSRGRHGESFTSGTIGRVIPLLALVKARNKGGLEAYWGNVRCFVPASRVYGNIDRMDDLVGKTIGLWIIEANWRVGRQELVCNEVSLNPSRRCAVGAGDAGTARMAGTMPRPRIAVGSAVTNWTLGIAGRVVWLGDQTAKVDFVDVAGIDGGTPMFCPVRNLIVADASTTSDTT